MGFIDKNATITNVDPNVRIKQLAMQDLARGAAHVSSRAAVEQEGASAPPAAPPGLGPDPKFGMLAPMEPPAGVRSLPAAAGAVAAPGSSGPVVPTPLPIPDKGTFVRRQFPHLRNLRKVSPAVLAMIDQAYAEAVGRVQAVNAQMNTTFGQTMDLARLQQRGAGGGGSFKLPSTLSGQAGAVALGVGDFDEKQKADFNEVVKRFITDKRAGKKPSTDKFIADLRQRVTGQIFGPEKEQLDMLGEPVRTGLLSRYQEAPIKTWIEMAELAKRGAMVGGDEAFGPLQRMIASLKPTPEQIVAAVEDGSIERDVADRALALLLTPEQQADLLGGGAAIQEGAAVQSRRTKDANERLRVKMAKKFGD